MTRIALQQLEFIDPKLRQMFDDLEQFMGELTITSLYRIGDSGVHGQLPLRGIDVRCTDPARGDLAENYMNALWQYDPARPDIKVCIFHDVGQGAHIHLQCHHNSMRIK
jgi:hypothetical protein